MTTMTLKIDNDKQELVEAFKIFLKNFNGVSYEVSNDEEEILENLKQVCKDIKSGELMENSISSEEFFKEFSND